MLRISYCRVIGFGIFSNIEDVYNGTADTVSSKQIFTLKYESLPSWFKQKISLLDLAPAGTEVDGVGLRYLHMSGDYLYTVVIETQEQVDQLIAIDKVDSPRGTHA